MGLVWEARSHNDEVIKDTATVFLNLFLPTLHQVLGNNRMRYLELRDLILIIKLISRSYLDFHIVGAQAEW